MSLTNRGRNHNSKLSKPYQPSNSSLSNNYNSNKRKSHSRTMRHRYSFKIKIHRLQTRLSHSSHNHRLPRFYNSRYSNNRSSAQLIWHQPTSYSSYSSNISYFWIRRQVSLRLTEPMAKLAAAILAVQHPTILNCLVLEDPKLNYIA